MRHRLLRLFFNWNKDLDYYKSNDIGRNPLLQFLFFLFFFQIDKLIQEHYKRTCSIVQISKRFCEQTIFKMQQKKLKVNQRIWNNREPVKIAQSPVVNRQIILDKHIFETLVKIQIQICLRIIRYDSSKRAILSL